jgi:hypothetical protein
MRHKNAWRWELDPRDPDYDDPPSADDLDCEPAPELEAMDDDPRSAGPWNYVPMRGDV